MTNMKNIDINELKNNDVFKVPENYFDTLTERVMSKIPAEQTETEPAKETRVTQSEETKVISINRGKKNSTSWWKWSSIAACIAVVAIGVTIVSKTSFGSITSNDEMAELAYYDEQIQEDMMEYSMLDADDVYCYLAGDAY